MPSLRIWELGSKRGLTSTGQLIPLPDGSSIMFMLEEAMVVLLIRTLRVVYLHFVSRSLLTIRKICYHVFVLFRRPCRALLSVNESKSREYIS